MSDLLAKIGVWVLQTAVLWLIIICVYKGIGRYVQNHLTRTLSMAPAGIAVGALASAIGYGLGVLAVLLLIFVYLSTKELKKTGTNNKAAWIIASPTIVLVVFATASSSLFSVEQCGINGGSVRDLKCKRVFFERLYTPPLIRQPSLEFSNKECEFKVAFPLKRPSVKTITHPLGNGIYSNTFIATVGDERVGRVFTAQCDNSMGLLDGLTMTPEQREKAAEWSMNEWSKMIGLEATQLFWERQGEEVTLKMIGRRTLIEGEKRSAAIFQARMYVGKRSTMMVVVAEPAELSPSAQMYNFLDNSVSRRR